jgi:amidohydrolase
VPKSTGTVLARAQALESRMSKWRVELHQTPELAYQEKRTRDILLRVLKELDVPTQKFEDFTGVVGRIGEDRPGPVVAIRADMDALPVTEATGLPFASKNPGVMHACAHDVHMACLLGAAAVLKEREDRLPGPIRLLFQPAEEQGEEGGALPLLAHGAFDRPKVRAVIGQHVYPAEPEGTISWRAGPMMASADRFRITVVGTPGHAGFPHRGPDAVLMAAEVIVGLQALVARVKSPSQPAVISVGAVHGGTRDNVLPREVVLDGTVRALDPATRDLMEVSIRRRVESIVASLGGSVVLDYHRGYPATINDPEATRWVVDALSTEFGASQLKPLAEPVMGAEDFSRYLERVPGTFLFLGVGQAGRPEMLHTPTFAPNPTVLPIGAAALAVGAEALQRKLR